MFSGGELATVPMQTVSMCVCFVYSRGHVLIARRHHRVIRPDCPPPPLLYSPLLSLLSGQSSSSPNTHIYC